MSTEAFILLILLVMVATVVGAIILRNGRTNPSMERVKRLLVTRSPTSTQYLTLGANYFSVRVDAKAGYITVTSRRLWLFRTERILPIKAVKWIDFKYLGSVSFDKNLETYRVVLVLKKGNERVPLVDFTGHAGEGLLVDAESYSQLSGKFSGKNAKLLQEQHQGALWYVRTLSELLDVGLSEPV